MAETTEPRALSAALAGPAFATRGGGLAMHVANRHVERWAPETTGGVERNRPMRSLGFVDRLISPWVEAAQRSASLRMFSQYKSEGQPEGQGRAVSWVFPRPWYQDELDWMAAARRPTMTQEAEQPSLFTTRGTYVAPASTSRAMQTRVAMPSALYEYVAPSLSVEPSAQPAGVGYAGDAGLSAIERSSPMSRAYSPLVPLAAVHAAEVMSRTVGRLPQAAQSTPALRNVLSTLLERSVNPLDPGSLPPTRVSQFAPELVTPPAPRPADDRPVTDEQRVPSAAEQVADRYAQQHVQIVELQRIARQSAERQQIEAAQQAAAQQAATQQAATQQAATQARPAQPAQSTGSMRTQTERVAEQQRVVEEARKAQVDAQAQIEERVQRRVAERQAQQLHAQARSDAATHARVEPTPSSAPVVEPSIAAAIGSTTSPRREAPPEVAAAIASLPPELASMLARRPDRAVQTIAELDQAYRAVELLARSAASGQAFEVTRGPRLMMPSGLGGLVAAIDHAPAIGSRGGFDVAQAMSMVDAPGAPAASESFVRARTQRTPMLPWVAPRTAMPFAAPTSAIAPSSALGATATATPAALGHIAWSDRWLARFAGASPRSLDTLSVSTSRGDDQMPRVLGLAGNAPGAVFVSPSFHTGGFDAVRDGEQVRFDARGHAVVTPPVAQPFAFAPISAPAQATQAAPIAMQAPSQSPTPSIERFDDDAETPDDVFLSISAAAAQRRSTPVAAPAPVQVAPAVGPAVASVERGSIADTIATAAPHSPNAGLAAQLAASPFAPALRHVLSIPSATSFDVRALFGGALSATYLAGLLAPESRELELAGSSSRGLPTFASRWLATESAAPGLPGERSVEGFDAAYVSPEAPRSDEANETYAPATTVRSALLSWEGDASSLPAAASSLHGAATGAATFAAAFGPAGMIDAGGATTLASSGITATGDTRGRASAAVTARELIGSMSQPLLGDTELPHTGGASWAAPGMLAERAFGWSVAQERSAADLSFDFVPPELVLAARVYGLGPAEAAQAARIAIAGPGQLAAMAGTVDRTFVQAMAFEAERRSAAAAVARGESLTAYPTTSGDRSDLAIAGRAASTSAGSTPSSASVAESFAQSFAQSFAMPSTTAFGVERRSPRGAFLWPPATVAALKLDAPAPDGQQSMSIAALELLAAQSVAELGTYAALGLDRPVGDTFEGASSSPAIAGMTAQAGASPGVDRPAMPAIGGAPSARGVELAEPSESDVLSTAISMVPMARRARFDALYLALGRSSNVASPAARAARALALAGRGEDAPISARERAASAWDVLPVVYAAEMEAFAAETAAASSSDRATGASFGAPSTGVPSMDMLAGRAGSAPAGTRMSPTSARDLAANELAFVGRPDAGFGFDGRPGLSTLSARAGEALGSYVAPSAPVTTQTPAPSRQDREPSGAVLRAPTAAQEMVQTGRPSGRFGGGEVEIPTWFEAAARKMFEQQNGGMGGDISIADLTLISSAPSNQIAASSRGTPGGAAANAPSLGQHSEPKPHLQIDVEKIANEIYRQILAMMDAARARNGEPYL